MHEAIFVMQIMQLYASVLLRLVWSNRGGRERCAEYGSMVVNVANVFVKLRHVLPRGFPR